MGIQVTDLQLLRDQLLVRREKLGAAIARSQTASMVQLLEQVDNALERVDTGDFGLCEHCHGTVEASRLLADPLTRVCLDCLLPSEQRALEEDLALAARIQDGLLPPRHMNAAGWQVSYHYEPARVVSGDYCDLIPHGNDLYFMLGDVSGKGVAASMLMANLHATFRTLIPTGLPLPELVGRANRIFTESTLPSQYATLIVGRASACGAVEISNGGHLPPFHVSRQGVSRLESASVPVGMFHDQEFSSTRIEFSPGDSLVVYTDGFTETQGHGGAEYGWQRLAGLLQDHHGKSPRQVLEACVDDLAAFVGAARRIDDQTLMVLNFAPITH
ncbi:MAG TPA: SpoIIE family protein phosphatase [Candidatus Angelobacter sp.]|nr:SpoIIE family protein phosphatase [Candidatus Angelobacter sp.]